MLLVAFTLIPLWRFHFSIGNSLVLILLRFSLLLLFSARRQLLALDSPPFPDPSLILSTPLF